MKLKRFVEGIDGTLVHDTSFVGENAWEDDAEKAQENIKKVIEQDSALNSEDKQVLQADLGLSGLFLVISFVSWRLGFIWYGLKFSSTLGSRI